MVRQFVQAINEGKVPSVGSVVEQVRRTTCQDALDLAVQHYCDKMDDQAQSGLPIDEKILEEQHQEFFSEAVSIFQDNAIFETDEDLSKLEVHFFFLNIFAKYIAMLRTQPHILTLGYTWRS